jgi:thiol-disulfide isomerase/thioredoxin
MMQKILFGLIGLFTLFLAYRFFLMPPSFDAGEKAPAIESTLINGEPFSLDDLKGQYVLVDFWGSWCGPCRKEIPDLKKLYADYHGRAYKNADDFQIVSIALEKSDKYTRQLIEKEQLNWPYHIIEVSQIVLMSSLARTYEVKELPTKFLINPDGQLMGTDLSFDEMERILNERLAE